MDIIDRPSLSGLFAPRVALSFALCFIGMLLAMMAWSSAAGTRPTDIAAKIAPEVLTETGDGGRAAIVILLAEQADLRGANQIKDQDARGWFVYNTLTENASRTQAGLRAELEARGVAFQSFWAANMIVTTADRALLEMLAGRSDVARIDSNNPARWIEPPELANFSVAPSAPAAPDAAEWGVQNVNAPSVWAMGFTGQGMVIGNQDTGMRWTHAALRPHYRGWNGSAADHNYSWHDAVHSGGGSCGPNTTAPCDDSGHGTHTTGTTVGDDGLGNQVGVAPGARWIGCRNMDQGNGTPATYTECFQFMIAPTDLSGNNANPALRPHVINNSWSCPASEGCTTRTELETIINNTQAAGIFVATSAGNGGPNCSTVNDPPGIYAASFAAGAYDINNTLANFSSRGPSTYYTPNLLKPNISAPGVNVRSTTNGGDTSYGVLNGTSMASPHVAGVVALLWSAHPELVRDIDATKALLQNTANPSITVAAQTCGGTPSSQIPNNSFGYGRVDAFAAVNSPPPAADATVQVGPGGSMTFDPPVANILVGQTVKWVWASPSHSVRSGTPAAPTNTFLSGIQDPPFAFYHKFPDVGGYDYFCEVHSSMMTGSISVSAPPAPTPTATAAQTPTPTPSSTPTPSPSSSAAASPSPSATPSPSPASVLGNISSRTRVETGDNVLIGGFIITGVPDKKVIVRALGPSLTLPDRLADPILELRDSSGRVVQSNDNWSTSPNRQAIMDAGLAPSNDFESAIIATLPANGNSYTAIVHGVGGITGTAVVEVYDIDRTVDSKLANLSTRGLVQTGDTILIAGTIVVGQQPQKVLVRAIGPSLDLPGKLADPILELRDANGTVVRADDNWRTGGQAAEIMQTTLAPTNDFESALIETLPANSAHTAIVRGVNSSTGIAVVEVYALN